MANINIVKGEIGNALASVAPDHILGVANDIFDENQQRYQQDINTELLNRSEGVYDISAEHLTEGNPTKYATLSEALGTNGANIPADKRKGGMSVKFVSSIDNKYVQCRLMADEFSTDTDEWAICSDTVLIENPEFVEVTTDKDNKVLWGVKIDGNFYFGAGCPPQVKEYLESKIAELHLTSVPDILTFLGNIEETTLADLLAGKISLSEFEAGLALKVDKVEGKSLIDSEFASSQSVIENPEFMEIETDSEGKILGGRKIDGTKFENLPFEIQGVRHEIIDNPEFINLYTDKNNNIVDGIRSDGSRFIGADTYINGRVFAKDVKLSQEGYKKLYESLNIKPTDQIEIAIGKTSAHGNELTEKEASPIVNDDDEYNVGFVTVKKDNSIHSVNHNVVAFNYDDGYAGEYTATRRITNKYGFKTSICDIFDAFDDISTIQRKKEWIEKTLNDGHEIGLHAINEESYWRMNKLYDVRPDGSNTFAPVLSELKTNEPSGNGYNSFGQWVSASTTLADMFYELNVPSLGSILLINATEENIRKATQQYCHYSDTEIYQGIDDTIIDDIETFRKKPDRISLTGIQWLEKWHNAYVDKYLGYSSLAETIADKFAEDYDVPNGASAGDYYPDAAHLLNGKMVYFRDTENAHYSEALVSTDAGFSENSYQLVGRFKKGLYKGCASTCNYEVIDRIIETVLAVYRRFFDFNHFTDAHRHGSKYIGRWWKDSNGTIFLNREKTIPDCCSSKLYFTRKGTFCKESDILDEYKIKLLKEDTIRGNVTYEGSMGLYYGQDGIRSDKSNTGVEGYYSYISFLAAFGKTTTTGVEKLSYSDYATFIKGLDTNWLKFFCENADTYVTRNGITMYIPAQLRKTIANIVASKDTGKVPMFTFDTIHSNPAMYLAVDLLMRFCRDNGYEVTSLNAAQEKVLSEKRNTSGNLFPNPSFRQSVLDYFGGSCSVVDLNIPDGWIARKEVTCNCSVNNHAMTVENISNEDEYALLVTRVYGLPAGKYTVGYTVSTTGASSSAGSPKNTVETALKHNGDLLTDITSVHTTHVIQDTDTVESFEIVIPDFHRNTYNPSDVANIVCDGYEDNVCCVEIMLKVKDNILIKDVSLYSK